MIRLLGIICGCLVLFSCRGKSQKTTEAEIKPYVQEFTTGPLVLKVALDRTRLSLAETIRMRVEARAPEGYQIELPELESGVQLFRWELTGSQPLRLLEGNLLETSRELSLEPIVIAEKMSVKPLVCKFHKEGKSYEVISQEIPVEVTMPPEEFWSKLDVDRATAMTPLAMPWEKGMCWGAWGGILCALLMFGYGIFRWLLHRCRRVLPPVPADVQALDALRRLAALRLVEQEKLMEFYNAVQDILRCYIEARFDIHAPELTTQEFMEKIRGNCTPLDSYQMLLENFFTHCDLVRFATYQPQHQEIQGTFDACKNFILESRAMPKASV